MYYLINKQSKELTLLFINFFFILIIYNLIGSLLFASGAFDNGTATKKGKIGIDLTINPFNYCPQGQSYAVISYGITNRLNLHSYYSIPVKGNDNYYFGIFYQFLKHKNLDLATAIGARDYNPKFEKHLFFPQLLYTVKFNNKLNIGGSLVSIRKIDDEYKIIGTTFDIALIIPIYKSKNINTKISSIDFTIGAFRPILWKPNNGFWHPTYSVDFKF